MTTRSEHPAPGAPGPLAGSPRRPDGDPPRVDRALRDISAVRSLAAPVGDVVVIVAAIGAAVVLRRWYADIAAALLVVRSQHAIAIVMHEGAHRTLLTNRRWNDLVGRCGDPRLPVLAGIGVAQVVVFGVFLAAGHPWRYLELWFLPYVLLLPPILRIRAVAEHGGKQASPDRRLSSRTTRAPLSPVAWLLAPHHVGLHVEHHLAPWVPHYRLPAVHRQLRAAAWLTDADVHRGYVPLFRWLTRDPVAAG